jgi:type III secretion system FlhB-like substrate exporter
MVTTRTAFQVPYAARAAPRISAAGSNQLGEPIVALIAVMGPPLISMPPANIATMATLATM